MNNNNIITLTSDSLVLFNNGWGVVVGLKLYSLLRTVFIPDFLQPYLINYYTIMGCTAIRALNIQ